MKIRLLLLPLLVYGQLAAQHINYSGHILVPEKESIPYKINLTSGESEVEIGFLKLKGNSVFKTQNGYLTLSGNYENTSSTLRIYTNTGKELIEKNFHQTINLAFSPSASFCIFHDRMQIQIINLTHFQIKTLQGSNIFAVNDAGQAAWYDENTDGVYFNGQYFPINEPVYRILFFKDKPLFITRQTILCLNNNLLNEIYKINEGRIFDVETYNGKLYLSIKKEMPDKFIFNSFISSDLKTFITGEEKHHIRLHSTYQLNKKSGVQNKFHSLTNETIRDPLYYYQDTVYQPVGNSYCEMQEYSTNNPYLHPGVDLLGTYLQDVVSVKNGFVKAILTTSGVYHWRIAIANQNTSALTQGYLYAHLEELSIPYVAGDSVLEGDVVGKLVDFPVMGFVHCHFARIMDQGASWNGGWWTFDNPLTYMTNFFDSIPPRFEKTIGTDAFAFRDANGAYLSPDSLYGSLKVISKVHDNINATWNVDVNKLRYSVSPLATPLTMLLDSFAFEYTYFNDEYFGGSYRHILIPTIYSRDSICFSTADYRIRDFYHIVTNSDGNDTINGNDALQLFNTANFPDGSYIFRITASDPAGNTSVDSMIIQIKNSSVAISESMHAIQINIMPNPSDDGKFSIVLSRYIKPVPYQIYNLTGELIHSGTLRNDTMEVDLSECPGGMYLLRIVDEQKIVFKKLIRL